MVWYVMLWYGMVWYGMVWYGMYVCICIPKFKPFLGEKVFSKTTGIWGFRIFDPTHLGIDPNRSPRSWMG